jgi:predicted permease
MGVVLMSDAAAARDGKYKERSHWSADFIQDVRRAFRSLLRTPAFTLIAILTIALGVGATTAVFSLANALLYRPLPIPGASRVLTVNESREGNVQQGPEGVRVPFTRFEAYRDATRAAFTDMAAHQYSRISLSIKGSAQATPAALVTRNYFDVMGMHAAIGSLFTARRDPSIVISNRLWHERFGADPAAVGSLVLVDGAPYTVIGVTPPTFAGTTLPFTEDAWVPIDIHAGGTTGKRVGLFGRLAPGVSFNTAQAAITSAALRIKPEEEHTTVKAATLRVLGSVGDNIRNDAVKFVSMLLVTAILVLLISSANIAGMQLTRAAARKREIAVQVAIGADRSRLVRQLITESVVLFIAGGIAGIAVAFGATRLFSQMNIPISVAVEFDVAPDLRVLLFALAISAVAGIVFGLAPALSASKPDLVTSLKDGSGGGTRSTMGRTWFVGAQIAVAVLLLITAGLFVRSLQKALHADPGFEADNLIVGSINLAPLGYDGARTHAFVDKLMPRLRAIKDVQGVGLSQLGLLSGNNMGSDVGIAEDTVSKETNAGLNSVDTAFFNVMKMKIVAGRNFNGTDGPGAPASVVINQALAKALWKNASPIGRQLRRGSDRPTVVGVVSDAKYNSVTEKPLPYVFYPMSQDFPTMVTLHVRSTAPAGDMIERVRREVNAIEPALAIDMARPMSSFVDATVFPQRFAAGLVGIFGIIGLILAALGVYGVLAFQVAQRTREFGIRVAIGATETDVLGGVVRSGLRLAIIGAIVGLVLAAAATKLIAAFLFGIQPLDPITFVAVPLVLIAVALLASYIPARRATLIPPTEALRTD